MLGALLVLSVLSVYAEGIPSRIYGPLFAASGLALVALLWGRTRTPIAARLALGIISAGFTLAAADLALRSLIAPRLYYRPDERFLSPWPAAPALVRYEPGVAFRGTTYGDLASISRRAELREERPIVFETDSRGFRNSGPLPGEPLDILLLGDSFGAGTGTSQESTWGTLLEKRWGYRVYNLSAPGGPWNELMNLKAELDGLPVRPGTVVLWAIFEGNDLDDAYPESLELPELNGPLGRLAVSFTSFRRHSPLRRLLRGFSISRETILERALLDGDRFLFLELYARRAGRSLAEVLEHENHDALTRVFAEMGRFAQEKRLEVAVVFLPVKAAVYAPVLTGRIPKDTSNDALKDDARGDPSARSGFATAVQMLCERQRFRFLDLTPRLVAAAKSRFSRQEYLWWRDDSHWNPAGHEVAAEAVVRDLLAGIKAPSAGRE